MRIVVVLGHPDKESFNHAIARVAVETLRNSGHEVIFHDLYEEQFDPILPPQEIADDAGISAQIKQHCDDLVSADGIVIVHPNWWGSPPAILKGWVDRVFRPGVAYRFIEGDGGEGVPEGLLKARAAVVFNTSNTREERENNAFGDPLETFWKNCIFGLCGVKVFERKMFRVIVTSTPAERQAWLKQVAEIMGQYFPPK